MPKPKHVQVYSSANGLRTLCDALDHSPFAVRREAGRISTAQQRHQIDQLQKHREEQQEQLAQPLALRRQHEEEMRREEEMKKRRKHRGPYGARITEDEAEETKNKRELATGPGRRGHNQRQRPKTAGHTASVQRAIQRTQQFPTLPATSPLTKVHTARGARAGGNTADGERRPRTARAVALSYRGQSDVQDVCLRQRDRLRLHEYQQKQLQSVGSTSLASNAAPWSAHTSPRNPSHQAGSMFESKSRGAIAVAALASAGSASAALTASNAQGVVLQSAHPAPPKIVPYIQSLSPGASGGSRRGQGQPGGIPSSVADNGSSVFGPMSSITRPRSQVREARREEAEFRRRSRSAVSQPKRGGTPGIAADGTISDLDSDDDDNQDDDDISTASSGSSWSPGRDDAAAKNASSRRKSRKRRSSLFESTTVDERIALARKRRETLAREEQARAEALMHTLNCTRVDKKPWQKGLFVLVAMCSRLRAWKQRYGARRRSGAGLTITEEGELADLSNPNHRNRGPANFGSLAMVRMYANVIAQKAHAIRVRRAAFVIKRFMLRVSRGNWLKDVIEMLAEKATVVQRAFRSYLVCTAARVVLLEKLWDRLEPELRTLVAKERIEAYQQQHQRLLSGLTQEHSRAWLVAAEAQFNHEKIRTRNQLKSAELLARQLQAQHQRNCHRRLARHAADALKEQHKSSAQRALQTDSSDSEHSNQDGDNGNTTRVARRRGRGADTGTSSTNTGADDPYHRSRLAPGEVDQRRPFEGATMSRHLSEESHPRLRTEDSNNTTATASSAAGGTRPRARSRIHSASQHNQRKFAQMDYLLSQAFSPRRHPGSMTTYSSTPPPVALPDTSRSATSVSSFTSEANSYHSSDDDSHFGTSTGTFSGGDGSGSNRRVLHRQDTADRQFGQEVEAVCEGLHSRANLIGIAGTLRALFMMHHLARERARYKRRSALAKRKALLRRHISTTEDMARAILSRGDDSDHFSDATERSNRVFEQVSTRAADRRGLNPWTDALTDEEKARDAASPSIRHLRRSASMRRASRLGVAARQRAKDRRFQGPVSVVDSVGSIAVMPLASKSGFRRFRRRMKRFLDMQTYLIQSRPSWAV